MKKLFLALFFLAIATTFYAQDHVVTVQSNIFTPKDLTVKVGETVQWNNIGGFHNVNGTQATYPDNPVGFGNGAAAGAPWMYQFTFTVPGTYDYRCDPHFGLGMVGTITVVQENIYPAYPIGTVTTNDANGEADSLGVQCQLQGIVYGFNLRGAGNGLQFTIIDANNDGIGVFSSVPDFGYTVTEGDEVIIRGTIDQFNGLTQIVPDTLWLESQGNPLADPTVVTRLDESTESQLVRIEDVQLLDLDDWRVSGNGFNIDITNGTDTFQMRIDNDSEVFGQGAPTGTFTVTGIGGQFDFGLPLDGGYQLFPRFVSDIDPYVLAPSAFPAYPVGIVTANDPNGEPDSLGVQCELQGIVYGGNLRLAGLQFTIIDDAGDGIGIFNNNSSLGYTVTEGDEVKVRGTIDFFNGLTQMEVVEVELVSTDHELMEPTVVTALGEATESQLITFENIFTLVDPTQWTNSGSGFNVDITTDGTNIIQMRIDNDVDIFGTMPPGGAFNLTGIGGQFDNAPPYDEGYQILPRYIQDIDLISSLLDPMLAEGVSLFPNPAPHVLNLSSPQGFDRVRITNALGQMVLEVQNVDLQTQFDLKNFAPGVYNLTIIRDHRSWSLSFVKQ